jgi:hypothetical protein
LAFGLSTVAVASAAPVSGSEGRPTDAQLHALEAAGIDPTTLRPGWTVQGKEIVWENGAVMASIEPMAYEDCSSGYLCFWEDKSYTGRRLQFQDTGLRDDMRDYSFNDQMSSWRSRRSLDGRWYYDYDGSGTSRCIESGASNSDVGSGVFNVDNDEMSSFRIYTTDDRC